ncbi:hypothetical protein OPQ81_006030 [Rhizoctonia solani]|nr:hypothetical protein OPQ81_006030 [Rhizoctonia solani]
MYALDFKQCVPECQATQSNTAISTVEPAPVATPTTSRVAIIAPGTLQHRATDSQHTIAALDGWAAGSFLQRASGSRAPTLGSSSWREWFLTNGSIRLVNLNWSPQCVSYLYLNTKAAETSYKPLAFEAVGTTLDWSFNGPNGTLSTSEGFNTFVTCSDGALYLQTGSDVPSGNCTTTRLGLGPW